MRAEGDILIDAAGVKRGDRVLVRVEGSVEFFIGVGADFAVRIFEELRPGCLRERLFAVGGMDGAEIEVDVRQNREGRLRSLMRLDLEGEDALFLFGKNVRLEPEKFFEPDPVRLEAGR